MSELAKPRAILFDWDNTLVNSWPVIHAALHHTFVTLGHEPWTMEQTRARVKKSMRDSFPELFGKEGWEQAANLYQQHYRTHHLENLQPLPQAEEVLHYLKQQQPLYMAVVSNKKGDTLRKEVNHMGWEGYFQRLVGADDAQRDKPHPDPVHLALAESGIEPGADVWFVGDSAIDLECAEVTGCTPLLFGEHAVAEERHEGFHYDYHAASHAEFLEWLRHKLEQSS